MLMPKRVKYRKTHRGRMKGKESRGVTLDFGDYGLQALQPCWMTSRQLEAARRAVVRFVKRGGKLWVRVFPDHSVTVKGAETRMGGGKGAPDHWVAVVKPGTVMFELGGLTPEESGGALHQAGSKMPCRTRVVVRGEMSYEGF